MNEIRTDIVESHEALAATADEWNRLALKAPQRLPMLSHAWVATYLEHRLRPGETWVCVTATEGGRLVGVLPLVVRKRRFAGVSWSWLRTPSDLQTVCVDFVVARDAAKRVIPAILEAVKGAFPRLCELNIQRIPEESPTLSVLSELPWLATEEFDGYGSFVGTVGDFAQYREAIRGTARKALKRGTSQLRQMRQVEMEIAYGAEARADELERFAEVEASSWKARTGAPIKGSPDLETFYGALVRRLSAAGWLEWCFLTAEDKTLAAQMVVRFARSAVIWKVGYDETYSKCSPGSVLLERRIKAAFESADVDEVNWMTHSSAHDAWNVSHRSYYNVYLSPRRPLPYLLCTLPRRLLQWLRRVPGVRAAAAGARRLLGRG